MERRIFLNAGHSLHDPGAIGLVRESDINRKVRDKLVPLLKARGFNVALVPDTLNLKQSIKWVNQRAKSLDSGLAFSIHVNCCGGRGAECYYYRNNSLSRSLAQKCIKRYCDIIGLPNRGARSSSLTRFGRLGWVEDTNCWAILLELGFIDNKNDVLTIQNYDKTAFAVAESIQATFGDFDSEHISLSPLVDDVEPDTGRHPGTIMRQLLRIAELLKVISARVNALIG